MHRRIEFASEHQEVSANFIKKAYLATEEEFLSLVREQWRTKPQISSVGTCYLFGVICDGLLYVANVGDSRMVLGRADKLVRGVMVIQLSTEHNASQESVRDELRSLHPNDSQIVVLKHKVWRVKGIIQVIDHITLAADNVPVFIAEIAPKNLRGALKVANQLMITTGVSVSFIIGTMISWRALALAGIVPCAVLLLGLFFIPESPRWLAKTGNQKQFEVALQRLRRKDFDISEEAAEIQDYIETLEKLPKAKLLDLFQKRYIRSVTIGVGLMVFQQFGGINGICFYVSSILESAGFPSDIGTIIYACIEVVITGLGAFIIDRAGRKPLFVH